MLDFHIPTWSSSWKLPAPLGEWGFARSFFFEVRGEVAGTFDLEAGTSEGWPAQFFKRRVFSLGSILDFHIPTWSSSSKLPAPLGEWGSKEGEGNMPFLALQKSCRHIWPGSRHIWRSACYTIQVDPIENEFHTRLSHSNLVFQLKTAGILKKVGQLCHLTLTSTSYFIPEAEATLIFHSLDIQSKGAPAQLSKEITLKITYNFEIHIPPWLRHVNSWFFTAKWLFPHLFVSGSKRLHFKTSMFEIS